MDGILYTLFYLIFSHLVIIPATQGLKSSVIFNTSTLSAPDLVKTVGLLLLSEFPSAAQGLITSPISQIEAKQSPPLFTAFQKDTQKFEATVENINNKASVADLNHPQVTEINAFKSYEDNHHMISSALQSLSTYSSFLTLSTYSSLPSSLLHSYGSNTFHTPILSDKDFAKNISSTSKASLIAISTANFKWHNVSRKPSQMKTSFTGVIATKNRNFISKMLSKQLQVITEYPKHVSTTPILYSTYLLSSNTNGRQFTPSLDRNTSTLITTMSPIPFHISKLSLSSTRSLPIFHTPIETLVYDNSPKKEKELKKGNKKKLPTWITVLAAICTSLVIIIIIIIVYKFFKWNKDHGDYTLWIPNLIELQSTRRNAEILT